MNPNDFNSRYKKLMRGAIVQFSLSEVAYLLEHLDYYKINTLSAQKSDNIYYCTIDYKSRNFYDCTKEELESFFDFIGHINEYTKEDENVQSKREENE